MALQNVETGRTIAMFRHDIDEATQKRVNAFVAKQGELVDLDSRVSPPWPEFLPKFGVAVIPANPADVCAEFPDLLYCVPEGTVSAPVNEDVTEDDESDLYDHLKPVRALKSTFTGEHVNVALLDTGFYPHPDFYKRVKSTRNFVGHDPEDVDDRNGHGTHCAGLIAGPRHAGGGYGLAPKVSLHIGRVLDEDGVGFDSNVLHGLYWAAYTVRARVIVLCCGMTMSSTKSKALFEATSLCVRRLGGVVIAAAGNRFEGDEDPVNYPANCPSVIAAGALDRRLKNAEFSCVEGKDDPVEVKAPGVGVRSAWIDGKHRRANGTSVSAAIAGGIAALLAQKIGANGNLFKAVIDAQDPDRNVMKAP
jgi:subtilisin family serine protease